MKGKFDKGFNKGKTKDKQKGNEKGKGRACYNCGKTVHLVRDCWSARRVQQVEGENNESQGASCGASFTQNPQTSG